MKLHQLKINKRGTTLFLSSVRYSTSRLLDLWTTLAYSCPFVEFVVTSLVFIKIPLGDLAPWRFNLFSSSEF